MGDVELSDVETAERRSEIIVCAEAEQATRRACHDQINASCLDRLAHVAKPADRADHFSAVGRSGDYLDRVEPNDWPARCPGRTACRRNTRAGRAERIELGSVDRADLSPNIAHDLVNTVDSDQGRPTPGAHRPSEHTGNSRR